MTNHILQTSILVLGIVLSGCALTTDRVDVKYQPSLSTTPIPGADKVSVNVRVNDQRPEKLKVSAKKNGLGMEMAPILANEDPSITLRRAIEQELRNRGFNMAGRSASVQIACDLTRFWNDHKMGFFAGDAVAELNMHVLVRAEDGRELFSRSIVAQGVEENTQLATGNNAMHALNKALSNAVRMLFEDQAFLNSLVSGAAALQNAQ